MFVHGDGIADLIVGGRPGSSSRVVAYDGRRLRNNEQFLLANFFVRGPAGRSGVKLAVKNLDGDRLADLLAVTDEGDRTEIIGYRGRSLTSEIQPTEEFAIPTFDGAYVG